MPAGRQPQLKRVRTGAANDAVPAKAARYDMRRLSYAGTFKNPIKAATIRSLEWLTAKPRLLFLIRRFERSGAPQGLEFWAKALDHMGISIETPADEIAHIPKTGPVVVVANHPSGLVDGMVMAAIIAQVRPDFKILARSLLTGISEVEDFMISVPFAHEETAREQSLKMRDATMAQLRAGGCIVLFPAGKVALSQSAFGPALEGEWNPFTHKIIKASGATIVPMFFSGQNSRWFMLANQLGDTWRQGLLLYEIKRVLNRPQSPVIGRPIAPAKLDEWQGNPRGFLAWLRDHTLSLTR